MTTNAAIQHEPSTRGIFDGCYECGCRGDTASRSHLPNLESVIDGAPDAILLIDRSGSIVYANRCAAVLFGFDTPTLSGESIKRLIPSASRRGDLGFFSLATDEPTRFTGRRADGGQFPIDVHFAPVVRGARRWTMVIVRDATEPVRMLNEAQVAKRAAEEAARVKGDFLGWAAHDLSQPVQTLELLINTIEQQAKKCSELAEMSTLATVSVARMRELLRMLLEISRIESGALRTHEEPVHVAEIFAYLTRQFGGIARAKGLAFVAAASDHVIETDAALLRGMLSNLVSNAIRYTQHGEVRLQVEVGAEGNLSLEVRDTGIGIPADRLNTIFQDFRRLPEAERMSSEGFGLGLGIVRRLSSLLRFPVVVQSSVGSGSTFRVDIPAAKVCSEA